MKRLLLIIALITIISAWFFPEPFRAIMIIVAAVIALITPKMD